MDETRREQVERLFPDERHGLAQQAAGDEEAQRALALDLEQEVREALAETTGLVPAVQELLVRDKSWPVRYNLAGNVELCLRVQHLLAIDVDPFVVEALCDNDALELETSFPVKFLLGSKAGRRVIKRAGVRAGADKEAVAALLPNWGGDLEELIDTAKEFSSEKA